MLVAGQVAISGLVALLCAASIGAPAGLAAAVGGGIGALASLAQVASGFRRRSAGDASAIARGFYRGEAIKIGVTVLLFLCNFFHTSANYSFVQSIFKLQIY